MASFIASQFKSAIAHTPVESWWGGGHTPETLPTNKGWRCRFKGNGGFTGGGRGLWLMGQRNVAGCASIQWYPSMPEEFPALDVALYDETPEEISAIIKAGKSMEGIYVKTPVLELGGTGLLVIQFIEHRRLECAS